MRSAFVAVLILGSSLVLLLTPAESYAEYRCYSWGYTDIEARIAVIRLEDEYYRALENEQDPNYQPLSTYERSSEDINDEINSIMTECIPEIQSYIRVNYLDKNYPLIFSTGSGDTTCLTDYPLTRAAARANMNAIDERVVMIGTLQNELQLSGRTVGEMTGEERRLGNIFLNCYDYFEQTGQTEEEPQHTQPPIDPGLLIDPNSECIIATAAFGSNLAPQVQLLRDFRDNHILSTAAGSSFMNVFNSWYYSFSPYVADYERGQPWMQQMVRTAIYPLLGILQTSEKAYAAIPGEYGALSAGLIASTMIGAVYFSPLALSIKQVRKSRLNYRLVACIIAATSAALLASMLANNQLVLMITTSLFVLITISISALLSARAISRIAKKISEALRKNNNRFRV